MTKAHVSKASGQVIITFTEFPDTESHDYWDDLMFAALPFETSLVTFYKGTESEQYNKADCIEFTFTGKQPKRAFIKRFVDAITDYLKLP